MHSDMFLNQVSAESHGVTRIRTSLNKLKTYFIPIPPLSEQHRIVAKIEELLPYIERYGKAEKQLTALNTTFPEVLKKSILHRHLEYGVFKLLCCHVKSSISLIPRMPVICSRIRSISAFKLARFS